MSQIQKFFFYFINRRQVIIRLLIVWLLGLFVFNYDEQNGFDLRFRLRSAQPTHSEIVILNISKAHWDLASNPGYSSMLKSARPLSDSYFWSTPVWNKIFKRVLSDDPKVVSVDLFFDRSIPMPWAHERSFKQLPGVVWRAEMDDRLGFRSPRFAINIIERSRRSERSLLNIGSGYIYKGYDNIARRYFKSTNIIQLQDLPDKVASTYQENSTNYFNKNFKLFINYRGPSRTYKTISLKDLFSPDLPANYFKDKMVIIGSDARRNAHFVNTPVGILSRSEYQANIIDNLLNDLWIKSFSNLVYITYLFIITLLCFIILHKFRQGLAVASLVLLTTILISTSIILFDIYNVWLPILSPLAIVFLSYIILMNHLLSESEYSAWKAQKKEESSREMNELKNNFVSLFSHDLKTPLAKIHAISDKIIQNRDFSESCIYDEIGKIQNETKELDRYIQSILQVTRIEAGEFNLNVIPQDINELIKECVSILQPLAAQKNISVTFKEEPLFSIDIDANLIKEVFINIIDNSIKYCPEGSHLEIVSSDAEDTVCITFSDNGPGVPEKEQAAVFEKFYRSKNNSINKKGTGLGLYLVRYFIEIHDGTVEMQSIPNQGTSFKIALPYEQKKESENS
ncbi:MAG: ATP-binding protein [Bdellovibrionales bacterium]